MGYLGIAEDAERRIEEMQKSGSVDEEKIAFWTAVSRTTRAVCGLSERYADALMQMAAEESDPSRAVELLAIADRMRRVPARPAKTFREALQSVWFAWMCSTKFNGCDLGRADQYLYPYYERDRKNGLLNDETAEELIDCFMLKCLEARIAAGPRNRGLGPSIMLGGLRADGKDGTNPLTYMFLRATERFGTPTPKLSVRLNEQTPAAIYEQAHRMLMKGLNQPDFYADRTVVPAFERIGVPFEDAVEYARVNGLRVLWVYKNGRFQPFSI
jgi:formate C-acetyltransferase